MNGTRDYTAEARALPVRGFDSLMHDYLWRDFFPHMKGVSALELGCFMGGFTRMLRIAHPDVTVVDASEECLSHVRAIGRQIRCVHGTFEEVELEGKFDAVFAMHCLEHLDDPVRVLRRIADEWLYDDGMAFIAVPNAHAASRQLAVRMGLLNDVEDVMPAEADHGHKRTYTKDLLERHLREAGLKVVESGGSVFKALAGFQMDLAMDAGIISKDYLDACYSLGLEMPKLCSSLYAVCEKS